MNGSILEFTEKLDELRGELALHAYCLELEAKNNCQVNLQGLSDCLETISEKVNLCQKEVGVIFEKQCSKILKEQYKEYKVIYKPHTNEPCWCIQIFNQEDKLVKTFPSVELAKTTAHEYIDLLMVEEPHPHQLTEIVDDCKIHYVKRLVMAPMNYEYFWYAYIFKGNKLINIIDDCCYGWVSVNAKRLVERLKADPKLLIKT